MFFTPRATAPRRFRNESVLHDWGKLRKIRIPGGKMTEIKIILPIPDACLSPNWRGHWAVRAKATKQLRKTAAILALSEIALIAGPPCWKKATAQVTYHFRDKRRRDKDNFQARLKAAFDGIVDAGILADDSGLTHLPMVFKLTALTPWVEIVIKETE
jgi:Endodeoxyribonuclease RusA.